MSAARELAQLLQDVTTRAEQSPASRNRPINLYATNYETLLPTEDLAQLTVSSSSNWAWTTTGSTATGGLWGQAQWRSS